SYLFLHNLKFKTTWKKSHILYSYLVFDTFQRLSVKSQGWGKHRFLVSKTTIPSKRKKKTYFQNGNISFILFILSLLNYFLNLSLFWCLLFFLCLFCHFLGLIDFKIQIQSGIKIWTLFY